jgi:uncharacterized protein YdeI (YjbR/CyaY-like superfamily)
MTDPRIDAYIENSADFAKPILEHIRKLVHKACPEVEEKIKWSMPHFDYKGPLCHMASFKQHCAFGFWKQPLLDQAAFPAEKTAMGGFGKIASKKDLPADRVIIGLIHQAIELNENGIKIAAKKPAAKLDLVIPDVLTQALKKDRKAHETFENFSYSRRKDYVEWITDAKTEATRDKRLATAIEWLAEGKSRNWKYEKETKK